MEEQEVKKTTRKSASVKKDEEIAELKDLIAQQQAMIEKLMTKVDEAKEAETTDENLTEEEKKKLEEEQE